MCTSTNAVSVPIVPLNLCFRYSRRAHLAALPFPSSKLLCREMTHWPITWWFVLRWFSTAAALPRRAVSFLDGRNDLPTAIRGPPPPRVAHSTPLGLLYLGTHAFFCRAAGSVVAPGFAVPPRPSGACSEGVCTRLGGFPVPRRKTHGRGCSL